MLRCADGSYYVGSATGDDLSTRVDQHNVGSHKGYTFSRRPVVLVWSEYFERITDGIAVERQLKGWSRAKKEALLRSDWAKVSELSRRRAGLAKNKRPLRGLAKAAGTACTVRFVSPTMGALRHDDGDSRVPHSFEARKSARLEMTYQPYFSVAVSACENSSSVRSSRNGVTET
jgi:putative endonuclease